MLGAKADGYARVSHMHMYFDGSSIADHQGAIPHSLDGSSNGRHIEVVITSHDDELYIIGIIGIEFQHLVVAHPRGMHVYGG
ncbi:MAG: hypothetical protein BWY63_02955 [Chloroflexi bacterium ADurb.Bin360]|nr:MAG: hypothetical protein BWY63_02955 [Chloroflexi bacterium ADurb.Bin360]